MFRRDGPGGPPCEWEWLSSNKGRVTHRNLQYIEYTSLLLLWTFEKGTNLTGLMSVELQNHQDKMKNFYHISRSICNVLYFFGWGDERRWLEVLVNVWPSDKFEPEWTRFDGGKTAPRAISSRLPSPLFSFQRFSLTSPCRKKLTAPSVAAHGRRVAGGFLPKFTKWNK